MGSSLKWTCNSFPRRRHGKGPRVPRTGNFIICARRRASPEGGLAISTTTYQGVVRLSQTRRRTSTTKTSPINRKATYKRKSGRSSVTLDDLRVMARRSIPARPKDAEALAPRLCHKKGLVRC